MAPAASLYVTIHKQHHGGFKHWRFYIEGPGEENHVIVQAVGYSQKFRFETRDSNEREEESLVEMIHIGDIPATKVEIVKEAAATQTIHNEFPGYNCQDYVIDLLDGLEEIGVIDGTKKKYQKQKDLVRSRQEGLE